MRATRQVAMGIGLLIPLAFLLTACITTPESYEQRMQDTYDFIDRWEAALKGAADDRGWSMLSASAHRGFAGEEQYVSLAAAADWSRFEIEPLSGFCDDLHACNVSVLLAGEDPLVPAFLLASPNDAPHEAYHLVHVVDADGDGRPDAPDSELGNAAIQVWWERTPWPAPGIGGGGG